MEKMWNFRGMQDGLRELQHEKGGGLLDTQRHLCMSQRGKIGQPHGPSYLGLEIVGIVVGVVGVHWLLLQTFSHVAGIQQKVLEAGERSSQVGNVGSLGLAWILQTAVPSSGECKRRLSPTTMRTRVCVCHRRKR